MADCRPLVRDAATGRRAELSDADRLLAPTSILLSDIGYCGTVSDAGGGIGFGRRDNGANDCKVFAGQYAYTTLTITSDGLIGWGTNTVNVGGGNSTPGICFSRISTTKVAITNATGLYRDFALRSLEVMGATSGSATISAPAVAGATILTLPSTSGTLATTANVANGIVLAATEVDLGATPRRSGSFTIAGTGLGVGKPVVINKASGPYTGKGTRADEAEMDNVNVSGVVESTTSIRCYWSSATRVRGNHKFNYQVSA